jgi:hypothetical protein
MWQRLTTAAILLTAAVLTVAAPASARQAKSLATPHVVLGHGSYGPGCTVGGATVACDDRHLEFDLAAASGPIGAGLPVFGLFERRNPSTGGVFDGTVTCIKVAGSHAAVGGYVTRPFPELQTPFLVYVSDNGLPDGADGISQFFIFGPGEELPVAGFPSTCPSPPAPAGYFPLTSGSIFLR